VSEFVNITDHMADECTCISVIKKRNGQMQQMRVYCGAKLSNYAMRYLRQRDCGMRVGEILARQSRQATANEEPKLLVLMLEQYIVDRDFQCCWHD